MLKFSYSDSIKILAGVIFRSKRLYSHSAARSIECPLSIPGAFLRERALKRVYHYCGSVCYSMEKVAFYIRDL